MNLKDRKVKSKLWIHSKRPDNQAIKRRKTNPTGTRTATGQARTLNKRPKSKRKRPVREFFFILLPQAWSKQRKKHAWKHPWVVKPASQEQTHPPHAKSAHTRATHTHTHTHTHSHTRTHTRAHTLTHTHTHTHPRRHKLIRRASTRASTRACSTKYPYVLVITVVNVPARGIPSRVPVKPPVQIPQTNPPSEKTGARRISYSGRVIPTSLGVYD